MLTPLFAEDILAYWPLAVGLVGIFVFLIVLFIFFNFVQLWIQAYLAGAKIGIIDMIRMKLCKVDYVIIVRQKIALVQAGVKVTTQEMEAHVLSRGNGEKVARAVIAAHKAGMDLPWGVAAAIDLAGRDVYEAVNRSVDPKVIDCPDPTKGRTTLDGVCRNGIQLRARARVTVRTKLDRLVGGATEETIIARVGEGIVKAIGTAEHHTDVLANPNLISQAVLNNALDAQTAFEIVSIDVAEIDVGAEHRRQPAGRPGRGRPARRPGQRREAAGPGRGAGAGDAGQGRGEPRPGGAGRGRGAAGHRPGVPRRPARRDGLLQPAQPAVRHADACRHRRRQQRRSPRTRLTAPERVGKGASGFLARPGVRRGPGTRLGRVEVSLDVGEVFRIFAVEQGDPLLEIGGDHPIVRLRRIAQLEKRLTQSEAHEGIRNVRTRDALIRPVARIPLAEEEVAIADGREEAVGRLLLVLRLGQQIPRGLEAGERFFFAVVLVEEGLALFGEAFDLVHNVFR